MSAGGPATLLAHVPGNSVVHRAPAAVKLAALAVLTAAVFVLARPVVALGALGLVLAAAAVARLPAAVLLVPLRTLAWWVVLLFGISVISSGVLGAVTVTTRLVAVALGAAVLTATTPVRELAALVTTLARPLAVLGVRPARIGLTVALTLRFVPVIAERAGRVREAQAARGGSARGVRGLANLLVGVLVQVLVLAHTLAEALDARGADAQA